MPRSAEQILAHADALARQFAEHEPVYDRIMDARTLRDIATAMERRAAAEREIANAVAVARAEGHTWAAIAAMLGTSGEAARQRYGAPAAQPTHGESQRPSGYGAGGQRAQEAKRAQNVSVVLEDDLDGGPADETVSFSLDGTAYEIDLSTRNAEKLRKEIAPFVEHARTASTGRGRRRARSGPGRERSAEIRAWAKQRGYKVNERGRIPAEVVEQYEAATK